MRQLWVVESVRLAAAFTAVILFAARLLAADVELLEISDPEHLRLLQIQFPSVTLVSLNNDNSRYSLTFQGNYHPPDDIPPMRLMLKVGEEKLPFTSSGTGGGEMGYREYYSMVITNSALVPLIAREFHATVQNREDPHYKMRVEFIPEKTEYSVSEPIVVIMRVTNLGDREFVFENTSLRPRRGHSSLSFSWARETGPEKVSYTSPRLGSFTFGQTAVQPSKSIEIRVDLAEWFKFEPNSTNSLSGSYGLKFLREGKNRLATLDSPIWTETVSGEFTIRIKP
jgi:hypothetical protein